MVAKGSNNDSDAEQRQETVIEVRLVDQGSSETVLGSGLPREDRAERRRR